MQVYIISPSWSLKKIDARRTGSELALFFCLVRPAIVQMMEKDAEFRAPVKEMIDRVLLLIGEATE